MKKHAKLPRMHIDNFWVDLGELYIILTVHGSNHKKSKCIKYHKWIQEGQADEVNHVYDTRLSCIPSYQALYLQHTEGVHQSIIIITNHYFQPSKMLKLFNSIHAELTTLRNSEGVKYEKTISIAFYLMLLIWWCGLGWHHKFLWQACLSSLTVLRAYTYARNWQQPFLVPAELSSNQLKFPRSRAVTRPWFNVAQCKCRGCAFWQTICYHVAVYTILCKVDFWPTPHPYVHPKGWTQAHKLKFHMIRFNIYCTSACILKKGKK